MFGRNKETETSQMGDDRRIQYPEPLKIKSKSQPSLSLPKGTVPLEGAPLKGTVPIQSPKDPKGTVPEPRSKVTVPFIESVPIGTVPPRRAVSDPLSRKTKSKSNHPQPKGTVPAPRRIGDLDQDYESAEYLLSNRLRSLSIEEARLVQEDTPQPLPLSPQEKETEERVYLRSLSGNLHFTYLFNRETTRAGQSPPSPIPPKDPAVTLEPNIQALIQKTQESAFNFQQAMAALAKMAQANDYSLAWIIAHLEHYTDLYQQQNEEQLTAGLKEINALFKIEAKPLSTIIKLFNPNFAYMQQKSILMALREIPTTIMWKLLRQKDDSFLLVNMSNPKDQKKPTTNPYTLVICHKNNQMTIIVGHGFHFEVAGKECSVEFAGQIQFDDQGKVVDINNHSGGYHPRPGESQVIQNLRLHEIPCFLDKVGLPGDKFKTAFGNDAILLHPHNQSQTKKRNSL